MEKDLNTDRTADFLEEPKFPEGINWSEKCEFSDDYSGCYKGDYRGISDEDSKTRQTHHWVLSYF